MSIHFSTAGNGDDDPAPSGGSDVAFTDNGAYIWFGGPVSHYDAAANATYAGWIDNEATVSISGYDHGTGSIIPEVDLNTNMEQDDHNDPSFLIRDDGHIMVFYATHSLGNLIRYRVSSNPNDISSFDTEQTYAPIDTHEYMCPRQRASDGRVYLFFRGNRSGLWRIYSDDKGATWSGAQQVLTPEDTGTGAQTYFQLSPFRDGKIDIAYTHPVQSPNTGNTEDIYHVVYENDTLYDIEGTTLSSSLPMTDTSGPLIYDSSASGNHDAWVHGIASHDGNPEITWIAYATTDDHRAWWARWDGTQWLLERVEANAGSSPALSSEEYYSGGIVPDRTVPGRVYLSIAAATTGTSYVYERTGAGEWTSTLINDKEPQTFRPRTPFDPHEEVPAVWMHGEYDSFRDGNYFCEITSGAAGDATSPSTIAHYHFEDDTDTTLATDSAQNYDLTIPTDGYSYSSTAREGSLSLHADGTSTGALEYGSTGQGVVTPGIGHVHIDRDFTILGWLNPDSVTNDYGTGAQVVIQQAASDNRQSISLDRQGNSHLETSCYDGSAWVGTSSGELTAGTWTFFAWAWDGDAHDGTLYFNDAVEQTGTDDANMTGNYDGFFYVANNRPDPDGNGPYAGYIDDLHVETETMSAAQVSNRYQSYS